jgi:HPt (histidine-containing phosphotransfer) domain-containing protein
MTDRIMVQVSKDIEALVPRYLDRRRKEIESFRLALGNGDFEALRVGGHSLKGSGGGYGFDMLTQIGSRIEKGAQQRNAELIATALADYADYMARLDVTFV